MADKLNTIEPIFIDEIPLNLEAGKIYISEKYGVAIHLCACGCKLKAVTPFDNNDSRVWSIVMDKANSIISLMPSVGNFAGENPYHAHYFITGNKIIWV
jgi:hypothetical protein